MDFEWDENKNKANIAKHGISFSAAARVFDHDVFNYESHYQGSERRFVAIGEVKGRVLAVIYTMRGENIRLISARRARHGEEKGYRDAFPS